MSIDQSGFPEGLSSGFGATAAERDGHRHSLCFCRQACQKFFGRNGCQTVGRCAMMTAMTKYEDKSQHPSGGG